MKKIVLILTAFLLAFLTGCEGDSPDVSQPSVSSEPSEVSRDSSQASGPDTDAPRISVSGAVAVIKKGEEFDVMQGVSGYDGRDGDITGKIEINDGGFDAGTAGEYTVTYFLADNAGYAADPAYRTIIVRETDVFAAPPVYEGEIEGEAPAPEPPGVFGGAWYHKVVSSKDYWGGMEATVTLPEIKLARYDGEYDGTLPIDPNAKNLDNPSVYLGGNADNETDIGLSLSRVLVDAASQKLSTGCVAFRPFWRYITAADQDVGGYEAHNGEYAVSANGNNCIANYHWKYTEYYYLPGDTLRVVLVSPAPDKLQLQIEVIEKSSLESSVAIREQYGWKDPENFISPVFTAPGFGTGMRAEYKRVNAIDQVANEGGTAIDTSTEVNGAVWHNTYLYREIDGTLYRVPMNADRSAVVNAPEEAAFTSSADAAESAVGGETVSIHPATARNG